MQKLVLLLALVTLGSVALFLSLRTPASSRPAAAGSTPTASAQPERVAAELFAPEQASESRTPAPLPEPEPSPNQIEGRAAEEAEQAETPRVLQGKFEPFPESARGQVALLFLTCLNSNNQLNFEVALAPEWRMEVPAWIGETALVEAVTYGGTPLWSRQVQVRLTPMQQQPAVLRLLPRAQLDGRVWDEAGAPIAEASVDLSSRFLMNSYATDLSGSFIALGALEGSHTVRIQAEGFLDLEQEIVFATSEQRYEDFVLKRPMRVAGIIRWPFGAPAEGVSLFLRSKATGEQSTTGEDGRFDFTGGPAMEFVLYARFGGESGQDFSGRFELDPSQQDLGALDLVLQRSSQVSGTLSDPDGLALEGVQMVLTADDNRRVTRESNTAADGSFTIQGLYPGTYQLTCPAFEIYLATVTVKPGSPEPFLTLSLPRDMESDEPVGVEEE